ncbi:acyl-protein synthase [Bacteroidota bacterium]
MDKFEKLDVPDKEKLSEVQKLCDTRNPYLAGEEADTLFLKAMKQILHWHYEKSEFYRKLIDKSALDIDSVNSIQDCIKIPFLHANFFKTHEIKSLPDEMIDSVFTSSGTTGQKSQMFFDYWSIRAGRRMVDFVYDYYGLYTDKQANYLISNYEPYEGSHHGATNTAKYLSKYAPAKNINFTLRKSGNGKHEFDIFGSIARLQEYEEEGLPVRIIGFPSFVYFILERMKALGTNKLKLNPDSFVLLIGGWKGAADKQIPKNEMYNLITELLGIPGENCRDGYGSVEHSVPYFECANHNMHVPVWSRMFVRDVKTLEVLDYNNPGFANFVTPYLTSVPNVSVMMGDLVAMHSNEECGCGIQTPYFEILGRAGTTKSKSCAVSAAELLGKETV